MPFIAAARNVMICDPALAVKDMHLGGGQSRLQEALPRAHKETRGQSCRGATEHPRAPLDFVSEEIIGLATALVLDAGGQTDHKLSSRLESVDFEGAAKLPDS
jgi:hypothetical protein